MLNTNYSQSCDGGRRFREAEVLGKRLKLKSYICSPDGVHYAEKPESLQLQLSVCPASFCPAACPFCIAEGTKERQRLDIDHFRYVMERLKAENRVRGVKITGGEPFYDLPLLDEVIRVLYETFGFDLELSVSTNGIGIEHIGELEHLAYLEAVHLSRHHYDDAENRALFGGFAVPDSETLRAVFTSLPYGDLFVLNCMLLKGGIDSPERAHRFLDFAVSVGASKVGFMECAPINAYSARNRVRFEDVLRADDPALLFTRGYTDYEFCRCSDGVYCARDGEIIEFYGRYTAAGGCDYCRALVYGADNRLRDGYGGEIIL